MKKRFSADELYDLRNKIPIETVITELLAIPSKISEGYFRFLCPICNEFQTAINPSTNLGRCFRCENNFNPIDLVMRAKGLGFRQSVIFLMDVRKNSRRLAQMLTSIGKPMEF